MNIKKVLTLFDKLEYNKLIKFKERVQWRR